MELDLLIGIAGVLVTLLVVVGMILITPLGAQTRPRADAAAGADAAADEDKPRAPGPTTRPSLPTLP
jgi:hypothetical protein